MEGKVFVIKKRHWLGTDTIVGVVSSEEFAKRYCKDMKGDQYLHYESFEIDTLEIPERILYEVRVSRYSEKKNMVDYFHDVLDNGTFEACAVEPDSWTNLIAKLLVFVLEEYGIRFWCYAKNAGQAKRIASIKLRSYKPDPDDFMLLHSYPTVSKKRKIKI